MERKKRSGGLVYKKKKKKSFRLQSQRWRLHTLAIKMSREEASTVSSERPFQSLTVFGKKEAGLPV